MLNEKWKLGWRDRGHDHGDYCVINKVSGELVIDDFTMTKELCEHIIETHNQSLV